MTMQPSSMHSLPNLTASASAQNPSGLRAPGLTSSLLFASVQDSRENLFSAAVNKGLTTPVPPKFRFEERRERVNWKPILSADIGLIR